MKKSYFITWLGALSTVVVTAFSAFHKIKKYGRKIYSRNSLKLNFINTLELADKGLDIALKKFIK